MEEKEAYLEKLEHLIGTEKKEVFLTLDNDINSSYEMEKIWNKLKKNWDYEYKYRKSGKTLCAFYFKKDCLGFMIILGKEERKKVEANRNNFSKEALEIYDHATTYHDGKWVMFPLCDLSLRKDMEQFLRIKRKPNRT